MCPSKHCEAHLERMDTRDQVPVLRPRVACGGHSFMKRLRQGPVWAPRAVGSLPGPTSIPAAAAPPPGGVSTKRCTWRAPGVHLPPALCLPPCWLFRHLRGSCVHLLLSSFQGVPVRGQRGPPVKNSTVPICRSCHSLHFCSALLFLVAPLTIWNMFMRNLHAPLTSGLGHKLLKQAIFLFVHCWLKK